MATFPATANALLRVANVNMERALRLVSVERGHDPRSFTLVAFGGAGPLHACNLAQSLRIPRVLVPPYPGVLSALGTLVALPNQGLPDRRHASRPAPSVVQRLAAHGGHSRRPVRSPPPARPR